MQAPKLSPLRGAARDELPEGVHFIEADLCTADGCAALARAATERLGALDIIINVLGGSARPLADSPHWTTTSGIGS